MSAKTVFLPRNCMFINYTLIAVSMSKFVAFREEVKHLMELIENFF